MILLFVLASLLLKDINGLDRYYHLYNFYINVVIIMITRTMVALMIIVVLDTYYHFEMNE